MVNYALTENLLTTDRPDDYMAQVVNVKSFDKEAIVEQMLRRGTLLTKTDILAVLNSFEEVVADIVADGGAVNTPLFNSAFSISGVFEGATDSFDASRHRLYAHVRKGLLLREAEKRVRVVKTDADVIAPVVLEVRDVVSGTVNDKLTPGGVIHISGSGLRLEGEHPDVGLWFVSTVSAVQPIRATVIVTNKPASLIAMIPSSLPVGQWHVRVATQYSGGGKPVKAPRVTTWERLFKVE